MSNSTQSTGVPLDGDVDFSSPEVLAHVAAATPTSPKQKTKRQQTRAIQEESSLPQIIVTDQQLREMTEDALKSILRANKPPRIFLHRNVPARIRLDPQGPRIELFTEASLVGELSRRADWFRLQGSGENGQDVACMPPREVARDLLTHPELPLPRLDRLVACPVFGADGTLVDQPGYCEKSRLFLHLGDLSIPPVSPKPSMAEVEEAKRLIRDEAFGDFPFNDDSSLAHAFAALLFPFGKALIGGCTPLYLVSSPSPGTGKGLLCQVVSLVSRGRALPGSTVPSDGAELRRFVLAMLIKEGEIVFLDNLSKLTGGVLASVLTSESISDRLVGSSEAPEPPNRALWLATGNNVSLSEELSRRVVPIRLDANTECPWTRGHFRHKDLKGWVSENRGQLVWAACTLWQNWMALGKPMGEISLGSFEKWSAIMGGVLEAAGIPGFLENLQRVWDGGAEESSEIMELLPVWWNRYQGRAVLSGELLTLADEAGLCLSEINEYNTHSRKIRFGRLLQRYQDRVVGAFRVTLAGHDRSKRPQYALEKIPVDAG